MAVSVPEARRRTRTLVVIGVLVLLVALLVGLAFGWWRYQRMYLHDDYVQGYALGEHWRAHDRRGNCEASVDRLYPSTQSHPFPRGSAAFRAGCIDGLAGVPAAGWMLHDRMVQMSD